MSIEQSQLLERVHQAVKTRYLSTKTESAYINHIRRFLEFNGNSDFSVQRAEKISVFLEHLQKNEHLGASAQNQARCALMFFYRDVLGQKIPAHFEEIPRARLPGKHSVVFTAEEIKAVLGKMRGAQYLIAALLYGSGLRLSEAVRMRVRDIDFEQGEILVRHPRTGARERATVLPRAITGKLRRHLTKVKFMHEDDCLLGFGRVFLPERIFRKTPGAAYEWEWQYVFPAGKLTRGKTTYSRHHLAESTVQKAVSEAIEKAKIYKQGCCQSLRYSFAVRLFERNYSVHTIHNLLGHKNLKTTMSYLNFDCINGSIVLSPLDN
jgi:integron integrase